MKLFKNFVLFAASFALCGCAASVNAGTIKANLEGKGYQVSLIDGKDTAISIEGVTQPEGLTNSLQAVKVPEAILAFFFDNIDHASSWFEANATKLVGNRGPSGALLEKAGQKNNCVYLATQTAFADSGIGD